MADPWQSIGADRAVLREKRIVIQDDAGRDLIELGKDNDGRWTLTFKEENGIVVLRSGEFSDGLYGMQALDNSGSERVRIGELSSEQFGLRVRNTDDDIVYEVDNSGQVYPYLQLAMGTTGGFAGMLVDDSTYGNDGIYLVDFYCVAPKVDLTWACSFPSGHSSTMDIRVRSYVNGSYTTHSETTGIATSSTGYVDFTLPSGAIGTVVRVQVEARRASGADSLGLQIALQPRNYG